MTESTAARGVTRLRVARVASAGAFATLAMFLLGWAWAVLRLPGADAFLNLFTAQLTTEPVSSGTALWIGSLCAFLVGGIFGLLIAHCYNLAGRVFGD